MVFSLSVWLNSILVQASDQEILGLAELMKDFLSLINTEGVLISDFNSQSKVKIGFISTKTYSVSILETTFFRQIGLLFRRSFLNQWFMSLFATLMGQ